MTAWIHASARRRHGVLLLCALLFLQFATLAYFYHRLRISGYLPSPFVDDKTDTFMDLYNTMYWAGMPGRYQVWASVYPPLAFLTLDGLRALFVPAFPFSGPHALRAGSMALQGAICVAYLLLPAIALAQRPWQAFKVRERVLLYLVVITSLPFLFALERGNLILMAPPLLVLLLDGRPKLRILALALLINLKPYFALLLLGYVGKRWWNELLVALLVTGTLYLGTSVLISSDFLTMLLNLVHFGQSTSVFSLRELLGLPSSVAAFAEVLRSPRFLASRYALIVPDPQALAALLMACQWGVIVFAVLGIFRRGQEYPISTVLSVLIVVTTNLGTSVGGYSLIFYLAIVPVVMRMRFAPCYLLLLFAIFAPLDPLAALVRNDIGTQLAYLSGRLTDVTWKLGVATAARPFFNLALLALLGFEINSGTSARMATSDQIPAARLIER